MRNYLVFLLLALAAVFAQPALGNTAPVATKDIVHSPALPGPFVFDVLANDTDADGDTLTISSVSSSFGVIPRIAGNKIEVTPSYNYQGSATIFYTISDGKGGTASATLWMENRAPIPIKDSFYAFRESPTTLSILANDSDPDGDSFTPKLDFTYQGWSITSNGELLVNLPGYGSFAQARYSLVDDRGSRSGTTTIAITSFQAPAVSELGSFGFAVKLDFYAAPTAPTGSTYHVEYGPTAAYGASTPETPILTGWNNTNTVRIDGLTAGTEYHFRVIAKLGAQTIASGDKVAKTVALTKPGRPPLVGSIANGGLVAYDRYGYSRVIVAEGGGGQPAYGLDGALYYPVRAEGKIRRLAPDETVSDFMTGLASPSALLYAPDGTLIVAVAGANKTENILRIKAGGAPETFAAGVPPVSELYLDESGDLFAAPAAPGGLTKITPAGEVSIMRPDLGIHRSVVQYGSGVAVLSSKSPGGITVLDDHFAGYVRTDNYPPTESLVALGGSGSTFSPPYVVAASGNVYGGSSPWPMVFALPVFKASPVPAHLVQAPQFKVWLRPPIAVGVREAILRAQLIDPQRKVTVRFGWGLQKWDENFTPPVEYDHDLGRFEVTARIDGLSRGTTYLYGVEVKYGTSTQSFTFNSIGPSFKTLTTPPTPKPDTFHLPLARAPFSLDVLANDSTPLAIGGVTQGGCGSVEIVNGRLVYTPRDGDFFGEDSFTYTTSDAFGGTASATVTLTNSAPTAYADVIAVTRGGSVTFSPLENDLEADGDTLTIVTTSEPAFGHVTVNGSTITYTAADAYRSGDELTYTISDAHGKTATGRVHVHIPAVAADVIAARGGQVSGMASGVTYATFGIPAISDSGAIAFTATVRGAVRNQMGIFTVRGPSLDHSIAAPAKLILAGEAAPGIDGARFTSLGDPVLDANGDVAFTGRATVGARSFAGIWSTAGGTLHLVAGTGTSAGTAPASTFKDFTGLALTADGRAIFTATVSSAADQDGGLWVQQADGSLECVLRQGAPVRLAKGPRTVKTLTLFGALAGSPDQRRGADRDGNVLVRVTVSSGGEALLRTSPQGAWVVVAESEVRGTLGIGVLASDGSAYFRSGDTIQAQRLTPQPPYLSPTEMLAQIGGYAAGVPGANNVRFTALGDPVANDQGDVAFTGTLPVAPPVITAEENSGIWFAPAGRMPRLLVQEGQAAPGAPGASLVSFTSLALPGSRGVAFTGTAAFPAAASGASPGIAAKFKGLWAQDRHGEFQLLLRTDGPVAALNGAAGLRVRDFSVLAAVPVVSSHGRSANAHGGFVTRIIYEDQSSAIVTLWVP